MTAEEILKKYWQHDTFRPLQADAISSVLNQKDTLAIMPTGGGKSVCFQIPSLMQEGICLVITPLIALMKDQVANLNKKGILSLYVHSGMKYHEVKRTLENAMRGNFKFLYVSPERLETSLFLEFLPYLKVNLIAVDEAHCISQWGYDFRPSYLRIAVLREYLHEVSILAVTASATLKVQNDICEKLKFRKGYNHFTASYERANLSYSLFIPPSKENKLLEIFQKVPGTGIVYCRSRKRTREVAQLLRINGIHADFYHAGLSNDERSRKQDKWVQNITRVICCTNAFGMGIDKPDVRTVVHFELPDALENYYQEAGRAGRDGKKSYAVLLFHPDEINDLKSQVSLRFPDLKKIREVFSALCSFIQLPSGKGKGIANDFEITRFIDQYKFNAILVTSVLRILEQEEILYLSENIFSPSTVEFLVQKRTLENYEKEFPQFSPLIKGLLRSYEGIFEQSCFIDEFILARFIGVQKEEVIASLAELSRMKIIEYHPRGDTPKIYFLDDRVQSDDLFINEKNVAKRKAAYEERLSAMIEFATQKDECRSLFINKYFKGNPIPPCNICDICLAKKQKLLTARELQLIRKTLTEKKAVSPNEIRSLTKLSENKINEALQFLNGENEISIDGEGMIVLSSK